MVPVTQNLVKADWHADLLVFHVSIGEAFVAWGQTIKAFLAHHEALAYEEALLSITNFVPELNVELIQNSVCKIEWQVL